MPPIQTISSAIMSSIESELSIYTHLLEHELSSGSGSLESKPSQHSDSDSSDSESDSDSNTMNDSDDSDDDSEDITAQSLQSLASFTPALTQHQENHILSLQSSLQSAFSLQQKIQSQIALLYANIQTIYSRLYPGLSRSVPSPLDYAKVLTILLDPTDPTTPYQIPSSSQSDSNIPSSIASSTTLVTTMSASLSTPSTAVLSDLHVAQISKRDRLAAQFPAQLALSIAMEYQQLQHSLLTPQQYYDIFCSALDIIKLHTYSATLTPFFTSRAQQLAPNLTQLISAEFAAQFIFFAQGLERLCSTLPHNLRSFGATKQHIVGSSANTLAEKVGVIVNVPLIQQTPEEKKKRAISLVTHKIILTARNDYQGLYKNGSYGKQLYKEIAKKLDVFKKINPYKNEKALPIFSQRKKPRRAGRLERLKKARLQPSELAKRSEMLKFGDGSGEIYDDMTGVGLGIIGNDQSSGGLLQQKSTSLSILHVDKQLKRHLDHYRRINDIQLNAFPILLGLKKTQFLMDKNSQDMDFQSYYEQIETPTHKFSSTSSFSPATSTTTSATSTTSPTYSFEQLIFGSSHTTSSSINNDITHLNSITPLPMRIVPRNPPKLF